MSCERIADSILSVVRVSHRGRIFYQLLVTQDGNTTTVEESSYGAVLGALQRWETYAREGGTIAEWKVVNRQRREEVAHLKMSL